MNIKLKKGFTLIELLVVMAIVSLLSSIIFANLNAARAKARDSRRLLDIHNIQIAMELYYTTNGVYPPTSGATHPNNGWSESAETASWGPGSAFQTAIAPYMPTLPVDPLNVDGWITNEYYIVTLTGYTCGSKAYAIVYKLENGASKVSPGFWTCDNTTLLQYNGTGVANSTNANGVITIGVKGY